MTKVEGEERKIQQVASPSTGRPTYSINTDREWKYKYFMNVKEVMDDCGFKRLQRLVV